MTNTLSNTADTERIHSVAPDGRAGVIAIVGLGYVGLPTAIALASTGTTVIGVDVLESRRRHSLGAG